MTKGRLWLLVAAALFASATAGAVRLPVWPGEIAISLLPQIALAGLIAAAFLAFSRQLRAAGIAAASTVIAISGFPLGPTPKDISIRGDIKIVWANVFDRRAALERSLEIAAAEDADLVFIGESPTDERIAAVAADHAYVHVRGAVVGDATDISVFSRLELYDFRVIDSDGRDGFAVAVNDGDRRLAIGAVHPTIPLTPGKLHQRDRHLKAVARAIVDEPNRILLGDFNTVSWSPSLARTAIAGGLRLLAPDQAATWITRTRFLGLPIDHALTGPGIIGVVKIGPFIGSDHYPLLITLQFEQNSATKMELTE